jgi:cytochrome c554/c'-like protein
MRAVRVAVLALVLSGAGGDGVEDFVSRHWRVPIPPQGPAPTRFSKLEASLEPEACGTCHPAQLADWATSIHAAAMGPGVAGQLTEMLATDPGSAVACYACHAPLAEQAAHLLTTEGLQANPAFDAGLRARGVPCAGCHVRAHERFGPPRRDGTLASAAARETLPHDGVTRTPAFLRSEFCRSCHQFTPDGLALNGKLVQDTYSEWRASRFATAGVQCQGCHMPDRRHLWRGIHDRGMVEAGLTITVTGPERVESSSDVSVTLRVENTGVGHAFPTYVTPAVVLRAELLDREGKAVPGSRQEKVIAREVTLDLSRELSDTRLRPGEAAELVYRRKAEPSAARVKLSVVVFPDAFYTALFEALLDQGAGRGEAQIREALALTRRSPFTVFAKELPLP